MSIQQAYEVLSRSKPQKKPMMKTLPAEAKEKILDFASKTLYSRNALLKTDSSQLLYVLLNISAVQTSERQERNPIHLCLIIDRSTSMGGERMDMVKKNLAHLIHWLQPDDVVSVVAFSDRAEVIIPPTECSDSIQLVSKLNGLNTSGATEIYQGLELGYNLVERSGSKSNLLRH